MINWLCYRIIYVLLHCTECQRIKGRKFGVCYSQTPIMFKRLTCLLSTIYCSSDSFLKTFTLMTAEIMDERRVDTAVNVNVNSS